MDTEQEYQHKQLKDFRNKANAARAAAELVDLIDRPLLTIAGWHVHADNQAFIGAIKVNDAGDEFELRVGRLNKTIAGTLTPKRRPAKLSKIDTFKLMMEDAFRPPPQPTIRRHMMEEVDWRAICKQI